MHEAAANAMEDQLLNPELAKIAAAAKHIIQEALRIRASGQRRVMPEEVTEVVSKTLKQLNAEGKVAVSVSIEDGRILVFTALQKLHREEDHRQFASEQMEATLKGEQPPTLDGTLPQEEQHQIIRRNI